jgi:nucleoside-diphosphate-sugar epimerase
MEEELASHNILVTGSSGFLGSYLVKHLKKKHFNVFEFDIEKDKRQDGTKLRALDKYLEQRKKRRKPIDLIINLMRYVDEEGRGGTAAGEAEPYKCLFQNLATVLNVCECAKKYQIRRVIHFSSRAVYGNDTPTETDESSTIVASDPYAIAKIASENIIEVFTRKFKWKSIIIRPTLFAGENQREHNVLQEFIHSAINGRPLVIYQNEKFSGGIIKREWLHPEDVCDAIHELIVNYIDGIKEGKCEIFVLGSSKNRVTMIKLAEKVISKV